MIYYLSLGSNLGDRLENLRRAVVFLKTIGKVLRISSVYETAAREMGEAPDFYNAVVSLESRLAPEALLGEIKRYETGQGRDPLDSHLRSRAIDIDILLAGDLLLQTETLTVPHLRLHLRPFVLAPLVEIAPGQVHPLLGESVRQLWRHLETRGGVRRLPHVSLG